MTQFPGIGKSAAMKWTAALWASGLFDVQYGKKHYSNLPGTPTVIRYRTKSTQQDWVCFVEALSNAVHIAKENNDDTNDAEAFKIQLTFCVRNQRHQAGLPIDEFQKRIDAWIKDGAIKRNEDGSCDWMRLGTDRSGVLNAKGKAWIQDSLA